MNSPFPGEASPPPPGIAAVLSAIHFGLAFDETDRAAETGNEDKSSDGCIAADV
jgi:hypothetical protein